MLLQPKRTKFKKLRKNYLRNLIEKGSFRLRFGSIALQAIESCRLTSRQLEATRQCIRRHLGRKGKIWIKIFPQIPVTRKPISTRMGKGKGSISFWCSPIKVGAVLFEICGVSLYKAEHAFIKGSYKLPIKTRILLR